ncbi:UDP-GalNAc:beta-1,3-N-acetylgalactosaminyltransferase 1 [Bulinus truncatus]|nr:UDP-GalNAc:beta-1,3-N-acetylgalactosaminyltransferase 1 [Bulinus truncatus]
MVVFLILSGPPGEGWWDWVCVCAIVSLFVPRAYNIPVHLNRERGGKGGGDREGLRLRIECLLNTKISKRKMSVLGGCKKHCHLMFSPGVSIRRHQRHPVQAVHPHRHRPVPGVLPGRECRRGPQLADESRSSTLTRLPTRYSRTSFAPAVYVMLAICVPITRSNFKGRQTVRNVGQPTHQLQQQQRRLSILHGSEDATSDSSRETQLRIEEEARDYGDILQETYIDTTTTSASSPSPYKWVTLFCPGSKYVLKADDDMYVNVPLTVRILPEESARPSPLSWWAPCSTTRGPSGPPTKWYIL